MKLFLILLSLLFCHTVYAETINLHWLNDDGTTYQNSTCVIDTDLILPSTPPIKYGYTFSGWELIPYTPVEYLESYGYQYIDTGIIGKTGIKSEIKLLIKVSNMGSALGSYTNNTREFFPTFWYNGKWDSIIGRDRYADKVIANTIYITRFESDTEGFNFYVNDIFQNGNSGSDQLSESNLTMYLFATNNNGVARYYMTGQIYYVKIWENNILVRDFIPVIDTNNVPCMYDKISNQLFYNQGTGQFSAGSVLQ